MQHCERIPICVDLEGITINQESLEFKSRIDKRQKYSVALKRKRHYDYAPPVLHVMDDLGTKMFLDHLPEELLKLEVPEVILLTATPEQPSADVILPPHVDGIRICCLNVYLDPHGERTSFYSYESGDMHEVESFVAQHCECWVLNTTVPHSVDLVYPHVRKMVSASFVRTPFDTVKRMMLEHAYRKTFQKVEPED